MLATLEPESVQTCVTSPPYWGLRSYGTEPQVWASGWTGELGSERTPELYVAHMVEVFRAVWRVLRKDGTLWLNLGFSYAGSGKGPSNSLNKANPHSHEAVEVMKGFRNAGFNARWGNAEGTRKQEHRQHATPSAPGYKAKDLIPIPFLVAMALQADGWYWRSTIVWAKRAPMPESVTDRPTSAWEPILLMSKARSYFYDADAVREPSLYPEDDRKARSDVTDKRMPTAVIAGIRPGSAVYPSRNMRNVWLLGDQRVRLRSDLSPEQRAYVLERLAAHMRRGLP
jgi:DNA modification methylase